MRKVAVTGGLSSGKSTVCQFFRQLGAFVLSADEIVNRLFSSHNSLKEKLVDQFGKEIIENGELSKSRLSSLAFSNPKRLQTLEEMIHPLILKEVEKGIELAMREGAPLFVLEAPLLYEVCWEDKFDVVVAIVAHEELAKRRFFEKTGLSSFEFERRMKRQLPTCYKQRAADYTLDNNGSFTELERQVKQLYTKIL